MSGYNEQQLNCKHKNTKKAIVGSQKLLRCLDCKALLRPDKTFARIGVTYGQPQGETKP